MPGVAVTNLYERLGVSKKADPNEIRKAYMKLARTHHPDKGGNAEEFKEIQRAYEVLSDDQRRAHYDMTGRADDEGPGGPGGPPGGMPFPFGDIFGQMFGGGGGFSFGGPGPDPRPPSRQAPRQQKAPPKVEAIGVTLHDFYYGKCIRFERFKNKVCETCKGEGGDVYESCQVCKGSRFQEEGVMMGPGMMMVHRSPCRACEATGKKVAIPCSDCAGKKMKSVQNELNIVIEPGMLPGHKIVFERECSDEEGYAEPGDVHIVLEEAEEESKIYRHPVQRDDLVYEVTVGLREALLGASRTIEGHPAHPKGLLVEIPVGVQNKDHVKVFGEGMPRRGATGSRGDLHVIVNVRASDAEKAALRGGSDKVMEIFAGLPV